MRFTKIKILVSVIFLTFYSLKAQTTAQEFYEKAKQKTEQKDYQYASTLIDKAIALNDTSIKYQLLKANLDWALKHFNDAFATMRKATIINPTHSETYNVFGTFYESIGKPDSSVYMYDLAIKYAENDSSKYGYLSNRGTVKWLYRNFTGALADYQEVFSKNPYQIDALIMIGQLYKDMGDTIKAIEAMKKAISINDKEKTYVVYINLGLLYSQTDSLDKSLKCFDKAIALKSDDPLIYSNRGFTYYKMKQYKDALKDVNKSIEMYPENSYAYKNLALIYFAQNNINEGCTALRYAEGYNYEANYGDEVKELKKKYCKN